MIYSNCTKTHSTVNTPFGDERKEARRMVKIDYRDGRPIYEQVADGIEELALRGALPAETQLPSVRRFAMELSINPNTIQRAYGNSNGAA